MNDQLVLTDMLTLAGAQRDGYVIIQLCGNPNLYRAVAFDREYVWYEKSNGNQVRTPIGDVETFWD